MNERLRSPAKKAVQPQPQPVGEGVEGGHLGIGPKARVAQAGDVEPAAGAIRKLQGSAKDCSGELGAQVLKQRLKDEVVAQVVDFHHAQPAGGQSGEQDTGVRVFGQSIRSLSLMV